ncbi:MAG: aminotransferase class I/II-fold pyridoxal phosphate-dependent enzyme [Oligoflexia bacterium]|nr:aminotransferase class I/II-fold pyridoxal phosphate-dependent enzyme [Oligoflexia bacterium]
MIEISSRAMAIKESVTLKLNEKAVILAEKGRKIYNLTAGQLPFKPHPQLLESLQRGLVPLKSFQYTAVAGVAGLRKKFIEYIKQSRRLESELVDFGCVVSNGAKHSIDNIIGCIVNPGDEVIVLAPYWVSYPEMIRCWEGVPVEIASKKQDNFLPKVEDIAKRINNKTKAIIINSPNNPAGITYPQEWMKRFTDMIADVVFEYPKITLISDEIYFELTYDNSRPTYHYQFNHKLLERTVIVDGISKSLACTGLRIGYCLAPKHLAAAVEKLQAQTTSGANALVQHSLVDFDFGQMENFLNPIRTHLSNNAQIVKKVFGGAGNGGKGLAECWYPINSAFYFLIDFSVTPVFSRYARSNTSGNDYSAEICHDLLEQKGIALVPGSDFGVPNSGRISLVLEEKEFTEAMNILAKFLS